MKKISFAIILSASLMFVSGCGRVPAVQNKLDDAPVKPIVASGPWTEVSHANYWSKMNGYRFPSINFSYPAGWKFDCCGDRDDGSAHWVYPENGDINKAPRIIIFSNALFGCPVSKPDCNLDEVVAKTVDEKYNTIVGANKVEKYLSGLGSKVIVKESESQNGDKVSTYIIKAKDGVLNVSFEGKDLFDPKFIEDFLAKIQKGSK